MGEIIREHILQECIVEMKKTFTEIMEDYIMQKYKLECDDAKYKDTETNIFDEKRFNKLKEFINVEAKLYRESDFRYEEIIEIINQLSKDISTWLESLRRRRGQGINKAKKDYESEKYYLQEMVIRLCFFSKLISYLDNLEKKERELWERGIDIEAEPEYEAYLLNKCIMLNQVGYCKKKCTKLVEKLNKRVNNSDVFSADFLYKLAELNFDLQNYQKAQPFIEKTIKLLKHEVEVGFESNERRNEVYDMLFSAYQFQVLSYEFCGNYEQAISILVGNREKDINILEKVLNVFEEHFSDIGGIDFLAYSNDDLEYAITKRKLIISKIEEIIKRPLFESDIFCFVQNYKNQEIINEIVANENQKIRERIRKCNFPPLVVEKVYKSNAVLEHPSRLICEYVHLLAHCLNEYAVTNLRKNTLNIKKIDENSAKKFIFLSRALMLYVSEQLSIYKTCYATTYAENGDFEVAQKELRKVIDSDVYADTDVTTKAEIAFFYYLIDSMCKIDSGDEILGENNNDFLNRYLNYCYRSFDYDAIALIRVYSFRNKIASMLQLGELEVITSNFLKFSQEDESGNSPFTKFVKNVYFQNKNRRLHHEYEKVKYMYSFLKCFFEQCSKEETNIERSYATFSYAFKYMYHYNIMKYNRTEGAITYVDFSHNELATTLLEEIYPGLKWEDEKGKLVSEYCVLKFFNESEDVNKLVAEINMDNKMYFIVCKDAKICKKRVEDVMRTSRNTVHLRYFESGENGLKEFVVFNTFFVIKDDFVDAQNIFVMTPIGKAESCKYRIINSINLVDNYFENKNSISLGKKQDVMIQYRAASKRFAREENWEDALDREPYGNQVSLVINLMYDNDREAYGVKYKYKYHVSEIWKEAILFSKTSVIAWLENLYNSEKYNKRKTDSHSDCTFEEHFCSVKVINDIVKDDLVSSFLKEIEGAFIEIVFPQFTKILLWRGVKGAFVSWRMLFIEEGCPINIMEEMKEILCCKGHGLQFRVRREIKKKNQWPDPHDYKNSSEPFLFICHHRNNEELLKNELIEFFKYYGIPVWYDKEKELVSDDWKVKIEEVIRCQHCVGAVVLIANQEFFKSEAVQYELIYMHKIKEERSAQKQNYAILPIVYGLIDSKEKLKEKLLKEMISMPAPNIRYKELGKIEDIIVPSSGKIITYLDENQTLREFNKREQEDGRGSILYACKQLGINYKRRLEDE